MAQDREQPQELQVEPDEGDREPEGRGPRVLLVHPGLDRTVDEVEVEVEEKIHGSQAGADEGEDQVERTEVESAGVDVGRRECERTSRVRTNPIVTATTIWIVLLVTRTIRKA